MAKETAEILIPDIVQAMTSPDIFGSCFPEKNSWKPWESFLKVVYGLPLNYEELALFRECTGRETPDPEGYREVWVAAGRRSGKSRIASVMACWEALFGGWESYLSRGEAGYIFIIATNLAQGKVIYNYVRSILELFPKSLTKINEDELFLSNGVVIAIKPASWRTSRGFSGVACLLDEVAFFRDAETSANPTEEIVTSLLPGLKSGGRLMGISSPFAKSGYLYEMYREHWGKDSDLLFWKAPTKIMNPGFSQSIIDRLLRRDKTKYSAEFDGSFRDDITNLYPEDIIRSATDHATLPPSPGKFYMAFLDASGGRRDSMCLAIGFREGDKIIIARVDEFRAPFNPETVVDEMAAILKSYNLRKVAADRFGGEWVNSLFKKYGISIMPSDLSASDIYLQTLPLFSMGKVSLPFNERMVLQFLALERRSLPSGRESVSHPVSGFDDISNTISGCILILSRENIWTPAEAESRLPVRRSTPASKEQNVREAMDAFMKEMGGKRPVK